MSQESAEMLGDAIAFANDRIAQWGAADRYWITIGLAAGKPLRRVAELVRARDGFALHQVPVDEGHDDEVSDGVRYAAAIAAVLLHFENNILRALDPERFAALSRPR